ncbi:MAG: replication/repair protein RecF [Bacillales bacterium]|jgi:DNA replication and repair protein RecF|nr:replication/repair protein RecF [Bacillales bacterium]
MHLVNLKLQNFRNYENCTLNFQNKINIFIGENAQGKTNILEAIYLLSMAKSHRTNNDKELIKWDSEFTKIEGRIEKNTGVVPLELQVSQKGKTTKVNHITQTQLSRFMGNMNVVMFAPEDLNLVKGSPQIRRKFLDMEIGQISQIYLHEMKQYHRVLQQKNAFLKKSFGIKTTEHSLIDVYNEQLVDLGSKIIQKRFEFLEKLKRSAYSIHKGISRNLEKLEINYQSSINVSESMDLTKIITLLEENFVKIKGKEIERGVTLIGPHRDDLVFFINGKEVQSYGSQGQQRTTALSLKLAEIELIHNETGEYPILLLDDVLSELDDHRQSHLLNTIEGKVQTFITTTNVDGIDHETINNATRYNINSGKLLI